VIPDRFKKEAKLMFLIPLALIIFGILVSLFVPKITRQLEIDSCLDGGGKYDYDNNRCIEI
jgi:hypothetical protein